MLQSGDPLGVCDTTAVSATMSRTTLLQERSSSTKMMLLPTLQLPFPAWVIPTHVCTCMLANTGLAQYTVQS